MPIGWTGGDGGSIGVRAGTTGAPGSPGSVSDITRGTNPYFGFSSRYTPGSLDQNIWDNPWAIIADVFSGINRAGPGYQALRNLPGDPLTLYNIMAGGNSDLASAGAGDYANWLAALYGSMGQRGGRGFDARELLRTIFGQQTGENSPTALGRILSSGDAPTQFRTLFNMVREATNAGMNPMAAQAYQVMMRNVGDAYMNNVINRDVNEGAANQTLLQWLRQKYPNLVPR